MSPNKLFWGTIALQVSLAIVGCVLVIWLLGEVTDEFAKTKAGKQTEEFLEEWLTSEPDTLIVVEEN